MCPHIASVKFSPMADQAGNDSQVLRLQEDDEAN